MVDLFDEHFGPDFLRIKGVDSKNVGSNPDGATPTLLFIYLNRGKFKYYQ
jgi:hypothetical protein